MGRADGGKWSALSNHPTDHLYSVGTGGQTSPAVEATAHGTDNEMAYLSRDERRRREQFFDVLAEEVLQSGRRDGTRKSRRTQSPKLNARNLEPTSSRRRDHHYYEPRVTRQVK